MNAMVGLWSCTSLLKLQDTYSKVHVFHWCCTKPNLRKNTPLTMNWNQKIKNIMCRITFFSSTFVMYTYLEYTFSAKKISLGLSSRRTCPLHWSKWTWYIISRMCVQSDGGVERHLGCVCVGGRISPYKSPQSSCGMLDPPMHLEGNPCLTQL